MAEQPGTSVEELRRLVQSHFYRLVQEGRSSNEAAVEALAAAKREAQQRAAQQPTKVEQQPPPLAEAQQPRVEDPQAQEARAKYGPLCLGLAGPFLSVCVVGRPRGCKKLLVLDIDHTIYDPSGHQGSKGSTVKSDAHGIFDESVTARCRPGLHEFLTHVYKEYDIMVWSASDMFRILTLLQQLGILSDAGQNHAAEYRLLAVLDIDSMSESVPAASGPVGSTTAATDGALVQAVSVPLGALPGQLIEVRSARDGSPMVVAVPQGLAPGQVFHMTLPGVVSSISEECGLDASELQLALQMSMSGCGSSPQAPSSSEEAAAASSPSSGEALAPMSKARRKGRSLKPLSLIWACSEFEEHYSEKNTVIVDDTIDVCGANPGNSIQCTRYYWKDHSTDKELHRLGRYLTNIAKAPEFPKSHECWRDGL